MSNTPTEQLDTFAVIISRSITHPGDERSRTHPGHGYPEHTTEHQEILEFKTEEAFRTWVEWEEQRTYGKEKYRAIRFKPVTLKTTVTYS